MKKEDCIFYKVIERLVVIVDHGEIYAKPKEKNLSEKKKKAIEEKGCRIDDVDRLPRLAKNNIDELRKIAAVKAFGYITSAFKYCVPHLIKTDDILISKVDGVKFEFTFCAWFCSRGGDDEIVSYSICSILDKYNKSEGKYAAFKRFSIGLDLMQNGKKGKLYDLEDVDEGTEETHGRGIKGVITDEGINKILC